MKNLVLSQDKIVVLHLNSDDWGQLTWKADEYGQTDFTLNLREPNFTTQVQRIVAIIVAGSVVALGLGRSKGRSGDLDTLVRFVSVFELEPADIDAVIVEMELFPSSSISDSLKSGGIIPPATGRRFFEALTVFSPEASAILARLRALQHQRAMPMTDHRRLMEEQRDAVALSLEVAGIDSGSVLQSWEMPAEDAPFLSGLNFGGTSEASLIRHDATHFEEWLLIEGKIYDVVQFVDPGDSNRKLTVAYADKEPLERVTGTDLIYFRHENPGYVLVQYKRMRRQSRNGQETEWLYRPDAQFIEEVRRMREIPASDGHSGVDQWRLSEEPFYMKLCEDDMKRPEGRKLTRGMYFPLGLFEEVLRSPKILGPRRGQGIGWHNAQRWLSNTNFIDLLRDGWIGSSGDSTDRISALVRSALEGGRGVILARDDSPSVLPKSRRSNRS